MRKVHIAVLGGGITGQLVQHHLPEAEIFDWQTAAVRQRHPLTRQFGANYLWKPLPGIDCTEFEVITRIDGRIPTPEAVWLYKQKIGKTEDMHGWRRQFQPTMRGYDFASPLEAQITWEHRATIIDRINHEVQFAPVNGTIPESVQYDILISTIPLYALLSLLGMPEPAGKLKMKPIFFKVTGRPPDAPFPPETMYVNYISDPLISPYRYCDRPGKYGERHYESLVPFDGPSTRRYSPGKIWAHPEVPEYLEVLEGFGVYTFGRFGSWNPNELIHETWDRIVAFTEALR